MAFVVGCTTDRSKIKNISIDSLIYLEDSNSLSFDVNISPNRFGELKVYFISKETYDLKTYGDYYKMYTEKVPEGKFTLSLDGKVDNIYVLFATVLGNDNNIKESEPNFITISGASVTIGNVE